MILVSEKQLKKQLKIQTVKIVLANRFIRFVSVFLYIHFKLYI